jgi:hypothetical protein
MSSSNANNTTTEMNAKQQTDSEYIQSNTRNLILKVLEDAFATIHIYLKDGTLSKTFSSPLLREIQQELIAELKPSQMSSTTTATEMNTTFMIKKMETQEKLIAILKEQLADARRPFDEKWKEREAEIHAQYSDDYADGGEGYERIKDELWDTLRDDIRDELKDEISNM